MFSLLGTRVYIGRLRIPQMRTLRLVANLRDRLDSAHTMYCPACGRRVMRERNPTGASPVIAHWRAVADQLTARAAPPSDQRPD
jgi:hypothetical protein